MRIRVSTAFVAANIVFTPIFWVYTFANVHGFNHYVNWFAVFLNGIDFWIICQIVILIAVFVVAFPLETGIAPEFSKHQTRKMALVYLGAMLLIGAGFLALAILIANYQFAILYVIGIALVVGAPVAALGRLIYPYLLPTRNLTSMLLALLMATDLLGPFVPYASTTGTAAQAFFPNHTDGELARWVITNGNAPAGQGMQNYAPKLASIPGQKYQLVISCESVVGVTPTFRAVVTNSKTGALIKTFTYTCPAGNPNSSGSSVSISQIDFGNKPVDPKLTFKMIHSKVRDTGKPAGAPAAFAVIAKAGLPW
jgi:hypothetical protein